MAEINSTVWWVGEAGQLTDAQNAALGQVNNSWALLDTSLQRLLCALAQSPEHLGQALTADLGADNKLSALVRLADSFLLMFGNLPDDPRIQFLNEVKKLASWVKQEKGFRNRIAHWLWVRTDDETMFSFKYTTKPRLEDYGATEVVTLTKLNEFISTTNYMSRDAWELVEKALTLPAWSDMNP